MQHQIINLLLVYLNTSNVKVQQIAVEDVENYIKFKYIQC